MVVPSPLAVMENVPVLLDVYVYVPLHAGEPPGGGVGTLATNGPAIWPRPFVVCWVRSVSAAGRAPMWAENMLTDEARVRVSACALATRARVWTLAYSGMAMAARMPMMATTIMSSMSVKPCWVPSTFLFLCQTLPMDATSCVGPLGPAVWIEKDGSRTHYLAGAVPNLETLAPAQIDVEDRGEADAGDPRWPSRGRILEVLWERSATTSGA